MKTPTTALLAALALALATALPAPATPAAPEPARVLLRIDDIGMNHAVNSALRQLAATGMRLSASVMFNCPWQQEAVAILREHPQIAVGVHLTLNSEWRHYRWGPVLGRNAVPSLVAPDGYFHPSTRAFLVSAYDLAEVERELEAQILLALGTGLPIAFLDFHMRTAVATPALEAITVRLAAKYHLRRSMRMGEAYKTMYDVAADRKKADFLDHLREHLDPGRVNLVIHHVAVATPEMRALVDLNNPDQYSEAEPTVALHRKAELDLLLSTEFQLLLREGKIRLVNYADL